MFWATNKSVQDKNFGSCGFILQELFSNCKPLSCGRKRIKSSSSVAKDEKKILRYYPVPAASVAPSKNL
jgi:hypothetical protein